jgi:uncharacterized peroxidase-related enzyme
LLRLTSDAPLVAALKRDWKQAELSLADRAMLAYTEKLTQTPADMVEQDVISLRAEGFSDSAILDINQVTGYYAFVNRLADGLGVEVEGYATDEKYTG